MIEIFILTEGDSMITLYTIHCPACNVLKKKLDSKGIEYKEVTDKQVMLDKGFTSMPMLEVDGQVLDFNGAIRWITQK